MWLKRRYPPGLFIMGILGIFLVIVLIFKVQILIEKRQQTKPVTYLFDQPVTIRLETSEDWLRGAVWIKPRLSAWSAAFSPDGEFIAVPMGFGVIGILRAQDGSLVRMLAGHQKPIEWVSFSPDGRFLASGDEEEIRLWSLATGETIQRFSCTLCGSRRAAFSPDGHLLAFGDHENLKILEIETGQERSISIGYLGYRNFVEFSDDGQLIASGSYMLGTVKVWRVSDGTELFTINEQAYGPVNFSIGGSLLASATPDGVIKLWRLPEGSLVRTISAHRKERSSPVRLPPVVLFSPNGDMLASGSSGEIIKLWSPDGRLLGRLWQQADIPLAFSPDGRYLVSGGATLKLWHIVDRSLKLNLGGVHDLRTASEGIESLAFSPDGTLLATSFSRYSEEAVKLWQMPEGRLVGVLPISGHGLAFSPDGQLLAVADLKAVTLWRVSDGQRVRSHDCPAQSFTDYVVAFSPDGTLLAAVCANRIEVWKVSDGSKPFPIRGRGGGIAFSPDSELLAVSGGGVTLYSARDGQEVRTIRDRSCSGNCGVAFSLDGQLVAASVDFDYFGTKHGIKIWRVSDGQEVRSYQVESRYSNPIQAVVFVPGKKIVVIAEEHTIKLWDLESGKWVGFFQGHTNAITSKIEALAVSPDGKYLASGGSDGLALWQIRDE